MTEAFIMNGKFSDVQNVLCEYHLKRRKDCGHPWIWWRDL